MSDPSLTFPSLTFVVPAYNLAGYIDACLGSILAQTRDDWRCIVIDDGSTDGTPDRVMACGDPRVTLVSQANAGVSAARNRGLKLAQSPAVMFLDGDDLLHPQAAERLVRALNERPQAVAAYGTFFKVLPNGAPYPGQKPLAQHRYPDGDILEPLLHHNFFANGGHVLIRTEIARAIGGFDAGIRLSEDWEFWCRLAAQGDFAFVGNEPEIFSLRVRPGSSSGGLSVDWANHQPALNAIAGNPAIRGRFTADRWARIERAMRASAMWEAGRVNFTMRRFYEARRLMLGAFRLEPTPRRAVFLGAALVQRITNRSTLSRLRFRDADLQADRLDVSPAT